MDTTPRHTVIKVAKIKEKERILSAAGERQIVTCEGNSIRLSVDSSAETLQVRREWHEIFNILKEKNLQPRILYPARLPFRIEGEIKHFPDKLRLNEFLNTKLVLQDM